jgi:hypothetical protein
MRSLRTFDTYPTGILGFIRFLNLKALLDATLMLLPTTGAIAVDLWDESRSGQETSKPPPHLGSSCCPLKVARNHRPDLTVPHVSLRVHHMGQDLAIRMGRFKGGH